MQTIGTWLSMKMKVVIALACTIAVCVVLLLATQGIGTQTEPNQAISGYETATAVPGLVSVTVNATGKIEPWKVVEVGTEVSGRVEEILVQPNDKVEAGQVIAKIRATDQEIRVRNARAYSARSGSAMAEAQANRRIQADMLARKEVLAKSQLIAANELVQAREALRQADARIAQMRADNQIQALQLESAGRELEKTTIVSPIAGVVLTQKVEVGQTLASSMTTPVMFRIASDLSTVRLILAVDEGDIGRVKEGMATDFTVEAYPNKVFRGTVDSVQLEPSTNSRNVTYMTVVKAQNRDGLLLPGMSANAEILVANKRVAVTIPVEALSFEPEGVKRPELTDADIGGVLALMEPASKKLTPDLAEEFIEVSASAQNLVTAINEVKGATILNKSNMEINALRSIMGPWMAKLPLDDRSGLREAYQEALKSESTFIYVFRNNAIVAQPVRYGEVGEKAVEVLDTRIKVGDVVLVGTKPKSSSNK